MVVDLPTFWFVGRVTEIQLLFNQLLAALAILLVRLPKAQFRHTQSLFDAYFRSWPTGHG
jgi:hypothetical protein